MVLKVASMARMEEEEEDVYLRKCNVRKSKRQNEKNKRISQIINEQYRYTNLTLHPCKRVYSSCF
jgi:hypothetical protein